MLNLYDADGKIQFDKDKAAEREYVTGHVATNSKRFASTAERPEYLISNQYYNLRSSTSTPLNSSTASTSTWNPPALSSALSLVRSSSTRPTRSRRSMVASILRDFPQRCAAVALELAAGNEQQAIEYADEMLAGRFQPATRPS